MVSKASGRKPIIQQIFVGIHFADSLHVLVSILDVRDGATTEEQSPVAAIIELENH